MIERAEREGRLRPGDTIVEASSGNTGNAMSMVAAVKGYRMLVVMPDGMSPERLAISPGVRRGGPDDRRLPRQRGAREGARARRASRASSRRSSSTPSGTSTRTASGSARRCSRQLPDGVVPDAIVAGVGTGGTLIGVGQAFRAVNPGVAVVGVEPNESCTLMCGEVGKHLIEGISRRLRPRHLRAPSRPDRRPRPGRQRCLDRRDAPAGARARPVRRPELRGATWSPRATWRDAHPEARRRRDVLLRRGREVHHRLLHARLSGDGPGRHRPAGSAEAQR